jgi:hypothetical protein
MSYWERVPTGSTRFESVNGEAVVTMITQAGRRYIVERQPIWTSGANLAIHKIYRSPDLLIERSVGGINLLLFRLGHENQVLYARANSKEYSDAVRLIKGIYVRGYSE